MLIASGTTMVYTALMKIVRWAANSAIVQLLISKGADVNASCYPLINGKRNFQIHSIVDCKVGKRTIKS